MGRQKARSAHLLFVFQSQKSLFSSNLYFGAFLFSLVPLAQLDSLLPVPGLLRRGDQGLKAGDFGCDAGNP